MVLYSIASALTTLYHIMPSSRAIKISNLHSKVRLKDLLDMFGLFDRVVGFRATDDAFVFRFESFPEKVLAMDKFPLAYKQMRVEVMDWDDGFDTFETGDTVVFDMGSFDADDIRDECSMFGRLVEVVKRKDVVYVVCETESDAEQVFGNMYGRFHNKRRIRCRIMNRADISESQ